MSDTRIDAAGKISVQAMLDQARDATGLSDFGAPDFQEGLDHLVEAANDHVRFSAVGASLFVADTIGSWSTDCASPTT
jgi:hypothetical protein